MRPSPLRVKTTLPLGLLTLALSACSTAPSSGDGADGAGGGKADDLTPEETALLECPDREPGLRQEIGKLIGELQAGLRTDIQSVDDLLAALPPEPRSNVLFLTDTRSMQKVYPRAEKERLMLGPTSSDAYSFHRQGEKWCMSGGGESCLESRVLMMSPNGDFVGSFATHPDSPAAERFEMVLFDPEISELTLFEVDFASGRPEVTRNPDSCMQCHEGLDGQVSWRMDPYRFWAYVTPFNEDFLRADSIEVEWYLSFLERVASGEPNLGRLDPMNSASEIQNNLETAGAYQLQAPSVPVDFAGSDTPALNLSHQLLEKNACRAAADLRRRDDWDRIKYAAMGSLIECSNLEEFFPEGGEYTQAYAEDYFEQMGEGLAGGSFDFDEFLAQNEARQELLLADRVSRRFDHYAEFLGEETALEEIRDAVNDGPIAAGYGVTNFDKYATPISKARYLLEPLGIDVTHWSMAVDQVAQSHVEFLHPLTVQPVFVDMLIEEFDAPDVDFWFDLYDCQNLSTEGPQSTSSSCYRHLQSNRGTLCPQLAEKSRAALADHDVDEHYMEGYYVEDLAELDEEALRRADGASLAELRSDATAVYQLCAGCHEFGYENGPPWLPFQDLELLEESYDRGQEAAIHQLDGSEMGIRRGFGRPFRFQYVTLAERIWDRVNRHPRQHGSMPRTMVPLNREQKIAIRAHMLKVLNQ